MFKILIIDDDPIVRLTLKRTLQNQGYEVTVASDGLEGIAQAQQLRPALIICDWMMSNLDGLEVCRQIKANPELATTFFILLTAKGAAKGEEEERVKGLDAGADEFLSKPLEINELKARVRAGLRLYQLNQTLQSQKQKLEILNQNLRAELDEAARYVRSLLPTPLKTTVATEWLFVPSAQLGGDCFDYYWLDDDNLVIYLLDVSGHGVGAALLSVSVLNILRSRSLSHTNFYQPWEVLKALNHVFQIDNHDGKYFTIWYGVYNKSLQTLSYASAGHPPAILISGSPAKFHVKKIGEPGVPIGIIPDDEFEQNCCKIEPNSTLYLFSDGVYEIQQSDGTVWQLDNLIELLKDTQRIDSNNLNHILIAIQNLTSKKMFDDDFSLLKVNFRNADRNSRNLI